MKFLRNLFFVLLAIVVTGFARRPLDDRLVKSMQERNLLPPPISLDTREELGQTSLAIALGGLRPLVAAMLNIKAHTYWEEQDWYELEQSYKTIVALQPRVRYYWEIGSWHLYSNAYADYADKPGLSEGLRRLRQKEFFENTVGWISTRQYMKDLCRCSKLGLKSSASINYCLRGLPMVCTCFETMQNL